MSTRAVSLQSQAIHNQRHNHVHIQKEGTFLYIAQKICALALGIFAVHTNFKLFSAFFLLGMAIGVERYLNQKPVCGHGHESVGGGGCSQGFLEEIAEVRLPAMVALIANFAATICHIDHHETVFVPIVALTLGAGFGKSVANYAALKYRHWTVHSF